MPKIIDALIRFSGDKDPKTYRDSNSLLHSICDFRFVFGLMLLKIILSNTDGLSRFLQGEKMDVVTAKKTVDAVVETLSKCRNEESFNLLWSRALIMAEEIKKGIDGTEFTFREAELPRKELIRPSRRPQALVSETPKANDEVQNRTSEDHYRVTCYYTSIDKSVAEVRSRFDGHDQEVLSGFADIVFNRSPANASIGLVSQFYDVDTDLLRSEKAIFEEINANHAYAQTKNAAVIVKRMYENGVSEVLSVLYKVFSILAAIPATSCSAERSFSALRHLKAYLRSTMGDRRLNSLGLINIEREYANVTLQNDMEKIIDIFGRRCSRNAYFF